MRLPRWPIFTGVIVVGLFVSLVVRTWPTAISETFEVEPIGIR